MSLVNIGAGVRIPEEYICYSSGTLIIEQDHVKSTITKAYDGNAGAIFCSYPNNQGPLLFSGVEKNAMVIRSGNLDNPWQRILSNGQTLYVYAGAWAGSLDNSGGLPEYDKTNMWGISTTQIETMIKNIGGSISNSLGETVQIPVKWKNLSTSFEIEVM